MTLLVLATSVPAITLAAPPAPASAAECDGVWVVVDARGLGGAITTRCAPGAPGSGLATLDGAGHSYSFVPRNPGMVCTIDARPQPCNGAPADAYWSYWHAEAGGSWTYASRGAGNRTPPPGSVEGWRFGDGSAPPGAAPPANDPTPPSEPSGSTGSTGEGGADDDANSGASGAGSSGSTGGSDGGAQAGADSATSGQDGPSSSTDGADGPDEPAADPHTDDAPEPAPGTAPGTTWRPDEVETGEWADPPAEAATGPDPTNEHTDPGGDDRGEETDAVLTALGVDDAAGGAPIGAIVGIGLLAGIAALTWRQHALRARGGS